VELYSEGQSDRRVLSFQGPAGEAATVIVMRRGVKVWLVFNGAIKSTVAMSDTEAAQLIAAVNAASRGHQAAIPARAPRS
jgi:hypothetical protein